MNLKQDLKLSVVIPVTERGSAVMASHDRYLQVLSNVTDRLEFIYVMSPQFEIQGRELLARRDDAGIIDVVQLSRSVPEGTALLIGIAQAEYDLILSLPPHEQIESSSIATLFPAMEGVDLVEVRRWPRNDTFLGRIRYRLFGRLLRLVLSTSDTDVGCGVRLVRREVYDRLRLYGDLHIYLALFAKDAGYRIAKVDCPQSEEDEEWTGYPLSTYLGRGLDLFTVLFLKSFSKKPLRFFGVIGFVFIFFSSIGFLNILGHVVFSDIPLADLSGLTLYAIMLTLGVQLIAIGLVGETLIFTSEDTTNNYVRRMIKKGQSNFP